jgi:hypothetical protein
MHRIVCGVKCFTVLLKNVIDCLINRQVFKKWYQKVCNILVWFYDWVTGNGHNNSSCTNSIPHTNVNIYNGTSCINVCFSVILYLHHNDILLFKILQVLHSVIYTYRFRLNEFCSYNII